MQTEVNLFVMDVVGEKTIASPPKAMAKIKAYALAARACGLSDTELADDISLFWPNIRRTIQVETSANGEVWVTMMPAQASFRPTARSRPERQTRTGVREHRAARSGRSSPAMTQAGSN